MTRRNPLVLTLLAAAACAAPDAVAPVRSPGASLDASVSGITATLQQKAAFIEPTILTTVGNVTAYNTGFGSAVAVRGTGKEGDLFLLTDRGPNVDYTGTLGAGKAFLAPTFSPTITRFRLQGNRMVLVSRLPLRTAQGKPITGLPNLPGAGGTNEFLYDVNGNVLQPDADGLDSEGLVALEDGSFWVSDEYGPHLAHFDRTGREIERWNPFNGQVPAVYAKRRVNRGMEGLTLSTDGQWLVGMMQSPLNNPSSSGVQNTSRAVRLLFKHLKTGLTKELLYLNETGRTIDSDIVAVSPTEYLVLERDGDFLFGTPASLVKRVYKIDISGATDISSTLPSGILVPTANGPVTLELATVADIAAAGIVPVSKTLAVDLLAFGYPHDKAEGIALKGNLLFVSNDDDFAVTDGTQNLPVQKLVPPAMVPDFSTMWVFRLRGLRGN